MDKRVYKDKRIRKINIHRQLLRQSLACAVKKETESSLAFFKSAGDVAQTIVEDDNQFYLKQLFALYFKYYAAYKRLEFEEGAKRSLLWITIFLKRIKMSKQKKTQILVDILKKYEAFGGKVDDIKIRWKNPLGDSGVGDVADAQENGTGE